MEDPKREETLSKVHALFQAPWVRALVAFIIFVAIFWMGVRFGTEYGQDGFYCGGARDYGSHIFMMGGDGYDTYPQGANMMYRIQGAASQAVPAQGQTVRTIMAQ